MLQISAESENKEKDLLQCLHCVLSSGLCAKLDLSSGLWVKQLLIPAFRQLAYERNAHPATDFLVMRGKAFGNLSKGSLDF